MNRLILILSAIVATIITGCKEKNEIKTGDKKFILSDSMAKMIQVDSVRRCYIDNAIVLTGEVSFNENNVVKVFPRSSGQVVESKVSLGDKVKAGQALATLHSADVAGNYADLTSANADIVIAKRQMDNTESLYHNGIASEKEYTEAKQNYEKALSAKAKIQSYISINGGAGSHANGAYTLTSPIDGYVVEKKVNQGNYIRSDMSDNLFTVSDLKSVWVNANVFETDIPKVKEGFEVEVSTLAYPDTKIKGVISKMSEVLDPTNKTLRARIQLNNPGMLLRPEMFAKVIVSNKENKQAICIPSTAIVALNGKNYVVVYRSNSDMRIAEVNVLKTAADQTYLTDGVAPGEKVITKNQLLIFQQLLNQ